MTGSSGPNLNRDEADPFSRLHKMSTTAGLGSGDYVAINGTAIAALLLGVCSALVLFNNSIFLLIPLLGVFAAIWGFVQISHSNGTQTGREVAAVGLLLSVGFGGFYATKTIYADLKESSDREQVITVVHQLGDRVKAGDLDGAYALMDEPFKKRVAPALFKSSWLGMQSGPVVGSVESIDWNHVLSFDVDPVDGSRVANGQMLLKARPREPLRMNMGFRNAGSGWLIDQIPQMFPTDAEKQQQQLQAQQQKSPRASPVLGPPKPGA